MSMMTVEELMVAIEALPEQDLRRLWRWLADKERTRLGGQQLSDVEREQRDLEILNARADYLNAEMSDVLAYGVPFSGNVKRQEEQ